LREARPIQGCTLPARGGPLRLSMAQAALTHGNGYCIAAGVVVEGTVVDPYPQATGDGGDKRHARPHLRRHTVANASHEEIEILAGSDVLLRHRARKPVGPRTTAVATRRYAPGGCDGHVGAHAEVDTRVGPRLCRRHVDSNGQSRPGGMSYS